MKRRSHKKSTGPSPVNGPVSAFPEPTPLSAGNPAKVDSASDSSSNKPFLVTEDFDLNKLRAHSGPSAASSASTISIVETVRVERPNKMYFFYIHPTWRETLYIMPADKKRKAHLVVPAIAERYPQFCRVALIVPYSSQYNNWFLWPIHLEDRTGRIHEYNESKIECVYKASGKWARFEADNDNSSYRLYIAEEQRDPPIEPQGGMPNLIRRAFEDRVITTEDHSLIRELLGKRI
jgi:hypothetical protein